MFANARKLDPLISKYLTPLAPDVAMAWFSGMVVKALVVAHTRLRVAVMLACSAVICVFDRVLMLLLETV